MHTDFDISIIIVNYNSAGYLRNCLRTVAAGAQSSTVEVIVVDNASFDGCAEMLAAEFPEVVFVQSSENLGFAGANNAGFAITHGRYILFLNPDTEIQSKALDRLRVALDRIPEAGIVGARLLNSDLTLQTTSVTAFPSIANQVLGADLLRKVFPRLKLWGMQALFEEHKTPVAVDAVSGACIAARRTVLDKVHAFSTGYFMYGEDLDLCLKVRNAGWKVYYVPDAVIVHHGGQSSKSRTDFYADLMIRQSMFSFMRQHRGSWYATAFRFFTALGALVRLALLVGMSPLLSIKSRRVGYQRVWQKWTRVIGWCVGLQSWVSDEIRVGEKRSFAPTETKVAL